MKYAVTVTQVYRVERAAVISVEAENRESAIENVASGSVDLPAFDDPCWHTGWDLQNEVYD